MGLNVVANITDRHQINSHVNSLRDIKKNCKELILHILNSSI